MTTLLTGSDLTWRDPRGRTVFEGLDLRLDAGERVALVGPSGCGKSTLLRCLVGLEPLVRGTVRYRGQPIGPAMVLELRRAVRFVPQRAVPIAPTLADEVELLGQRVVAVARKLGLDADLTQSLARLSGGEQHRWGLARALADEPTVLLLDEPTSSLDPVATDATEALLQRWLTPDRAWIWISHEAAQHARISDRLITTS